MRPRNQQGHHACISAGYLILIKEQQAPTIGSFPLKEFTFFDRRNSGSPGLAFRLRLEQSVVTDSVTEGCNAWLALKLGWYSL